jgi:pimeloyl-ACP methyl ester carboxylesterase
MPAVHANGLTIEYESLGSPADPPIVLIMGLGMQLIAWPDDFCQRLVAQGFRVIRFDNRDAGLSGRCAGRRTPNLVLAMLAARLGLPVRAPYSLDDMADDTVALMDALQISRAHLVGLSMGGMIAQVLAVRFAERLFSLTSIMSSSGNRRASKPKPEALRVLLHTPASDDTEAAISHYMHLFGVIGSPGFPTPESLRRERITRWVQRAYDPAARNRQLLAVIAGGDRRRSLRRITVPTLVIHGADDPLIPVAAGRDTARNVPGAELKVIDGMGHDLADALLPVLADAIAEHCRRHAPAAAGTLVPPR